MKLLAVETSSEACSVALEASGRLIERHTHAPLAHAELLLPAIREVLGEAGFGFGSLDAIVFGRGPGSFTSLRIGIAAVQGIAWGAGVPVVPVSSLAAVAQQAVDAGADEVLVALDARMDEVFSARFAVVAGIVQPLGEETVGPAGAIAVDRPARTIGCGNGFERFPELQALGRNLMAVHADLLPRASALFPLAHGWLREHEPLPPDMAQPVYVRDHVADKP
jgi:tRNA threonylcarbamoyladenosine biosynthesis protein TsaB